MKGPRRWVRFLQEGQAMWGFATADHIQACAGSPFDDSHCTLERLPFEGMEYLPACQPSKIVCIGRNYREHARELGNEPPKEPMFFLKPPSSLLAHGGVIRLPGLSRQVEHEGELGVVLRRRCHRLKAGEDVRPYVLGLTCVNDVTARDLQKTDTQWTRAKGFDTFCPVGPWIVECDGSAEAWCGLRIETRVNGEVRQSGTTHDFIFGLGELLRAVSAVMTLEPGDLLATGTPAGVGPLRPGDTVSVEIESIGKLENRVEAEA